MTRLSDLRDTTSDGLRQRLRGDLDAIVLTALRKEPDRRYASADDFASDVRRHLAGRPVLARGDGATYRLRKFVRRHRISATAAAIGMAAGIGVIVAAARSGAWGLGEARDAAGRIVPGATRRVAFGAALELDPAPSPDGRMLAYAADSGGVMRIYVRPLAGGPVAALTAAIPGYHRAPRWSPDGSRIAFQSEGSLYVVPAAGGTPQGLVSAPREGSWVAYPAWSPDGRQIAYVQDWAVYARPTAGGQPRLVTPVANEPHSLAWSPDGRWIALVAGNWEFTFGIRPWGTTVNLGNIAPSEIWLVPAAGGAPVRVTEGRALNTSPVWLPDGRGLLFVSNRDGDRDVYHVRIGDDGRVASAPSRVTAGLGAHSVALSRDGTRLVYSVFRSAANLWALPLGDGQPVDETGARPVTRGSQMIEGVSVSRDGRWLAFDTDRNGNQDVYVVATDGGDQAWQAGEPTPLASDAADEFMPHWSPSGRELAYYRFGPDGRRRMMTIRFPEGDARPVTDRPADQRSPHWSPDGRSLVFSSDETGRHELYVVTRETDGRWGRARPLTADGGYAGRWSPDGRTISFVRQDGIWTIPSAGGAPRPVLRIPPAQEPSLGFVEWGADGRTLIYKWVDEQGRASFWTIPAQGGAARLLARVADPQRPSPRPEFATDGRRLYFTIAERVSDLWSMELSSSPR
jgi:Tol biopolymer transport system component